MSKTRSDQVTLEEDTGPWRLEFDYKYSLSEYPSLPFVLVNPDDVERRIEYTGHIDTGSTHTSLRRDMAAVLGLDLTHGSHMEVYSGGRKIDGLLKELRMEHEDLGVFMVDVLVRDAGTESFLLGRDILRDLDVAFKFNEPCFYVSLANKSRNLTTQTAS